MTGTAILLTVQGKYFTDIAIFIDIIFFYSSIFITNKTVECSGLLIKTQKS